jgi:RsiW-degrading membrane proteinase PrsW (M82 family)
MIASLLALAATLIPTSLYALLLWWLDRYEKEPWPLLLAAFGWGALSVLPLLLFSGGAIGPSTSVSLLVPVIEETLKALALVVLFVFRRDEFDGPLDGIVYGALIGFGFAMVENFFYFLWHPETLSALFWLRSIVFGLNHAFFTSVVGITLGAMRYVSRRWLSYPALLVSLLGAICLHMLHNAAVHHLLGALLSWISLSMGVLVVLAVAMLAWRSERRCLLEELGEEILLGLMSEADYAEVVSPARRTRAQLRALLRGDLRRYQRIARLHHDITELAFCKHRLRIGDPAIDAARLPELRGEIATLRAQLHEQPGQLWSQT